MGVIFLGLGAPLGRSWAAFWASGTVLGGPKSEKMQTILCENHFFENSLFGFLEPSLALLGSLGASCAGLGAKMVPKMAPKVVPKLVSKLAKTKTNLNSFRTFF